MNLLSNYIKFFLQEIKIREADLSGNLKAEWGSQEHIDDLNARIEDLTAWRDKQRKGSDSRANYARLINQLRAELRSAQRTYGKNAPETLNSSSQLQRPNF